MYNCNDLWWIFFSSWAKAGGQGAEWKEDLLESKDGNVVRVGTRCSVEGNEPQDAAGRGAGSQRLRFERGKSTWRKRPRQQHSTRGTKGPSQLLRDRPAWMARAGVDKYKEN